MCVCSRVYVCVSVNVYVYVYACVHRIVYVYERANLMHSVDTLI